MMKFCAPRFFHQRIAPNVAKVTEGVVSTFRVLQSSGVVRCGQVRNSAFSFFLLRETMQKFFRMCSLGYLQPTLAVKLTSCKSRIDTRLLTLSEVHRRRCVGGVIHIVHENLYQIELLLRVFCCWFVFENLFKNMVLAS